MDDLVGDLIKPILRLFGLIVRALFWLFWETSLQPLVWYLGWLLCRLFSFGNLPKEKITEQDEATLLCQCIVCLSGVSSLIFIGTAIAIYAGEI
jgi:hypothetical protein